MRKQILTIAVAIFSVFTTINAASNPTVAKLYSLDLSAWNKSDLTITLQDENAVTIYTEVLAAGTKSRNFDLANLANGTYEMIIDNATQEVTKIIDVNYKSVNTIDTKVAYKPTFRSDANNWTLDYLAQGKNVTVSIYETRDGKKVFSKNYDKVTALNKAYNVAELPKGNFNFVVSAGNKTYSYNVSK